MQQLAVLLRCDHRLLNPDAALAARPDVLVGVPMGAKEALAACSIETVGDLARLALFANGVKIRDIAESARSAGDGAWALLPRDIVHSGYNIALADLPACPGSVGAVQPCHGEGTDCARQHHGGGDHSRSG